MTSSGDIHPWVTEGLLYYGLITQEQADEADRRYEVMWERAWEDARWWNTVASIAWHNTSSLWTKICWVNTPSVSWTDDWIREKRGW